jgi:hypothetical protein
VSKSAEEGFDNLQSKIPPLLGIIHQLEDINILTIQLDIDETGDTADFDFIGIFFIYLGSLLTVGMELWKATTMLRKRAPPQILNRSFGQCNTPTELSICYPANW